MAVAVRIRPVNASDPDSAKVAVARDQLEANTITVDDQKRGRNFAFDHVFTEGQEAVFDAIGRPMIEEAFKGFNVCLFAYGQTGSGKTHSIQGGATAELEGIVPRFVREMFRKAQGLVESDSDLTVKVTMTYLEVYMERVRDLLVPRVKGQEPESLELMEVKGRVIVNGASVHSVLGPDRVNELIAIGNSNRQVAETRMNEFSSRSHSIIRFTIAQLHEAIDRRDIECTVTLVDLAGSERQGKTESTGLQFEEAKKINQSLLSLGRALNSFSEGRGDMVSLRESKLTRLLSDSFGGNAKTWMLATVAPTAYNVTESLSTLEYATHAKNITNRVTINTVARKLEYAELREREGKLRIALDEIRVQKAQAQGAYDSAKAQNAQLVATLSEQLNAEPETALADAVAETSRLRSLLMTLLQEHKAVAVDADGHVIPCFTASCYVDFAQAVSKGFEYAEACFEADLDDGRGQAILTVNAFANIDPDGMTFDVQLAQIRGLPLRCRRGARVAFFIEGCPEATISTPIASEHNGAVRFDFRKRFRWAGKITPVQGACIRVQFNVTGYC
jgi:hypothetical protein